MTGIDLPAINIGGAVDRFISPRVLSGWVRDNTDPSRSGEILVSIYRGDRLLAQGHPTSVRGDIGDVLTNFRLVCSEDIPDEAIAFEMLRIEALDCHGRSHPIGIWDVVKAASLERLLAMAPAPGMSWARTVLSALGNCKNFPVPAREAILKIHDLYFEEDNRRLMFLFEGLGRDCSFGAIQRSYGAEPLGLFRFAGIGIEGILTAMRSRFLGIGEPEFTRVVADKDSREYYTKDTRYGMSSHTYIYEGDVDYDDFYQKQCKKLQFLVRNMLEKLTDERKIFVIHNIPDVFSDEKLAELYGVIQGYGAGRLLYLQSSTDECPPGTFLMRDDGIMHGYVLQYQDNVTTPDAAIRSSWLTVMKKAETEVFRA